MYKYIFSFILYLVVVLSYITSQYVYKTSVYHENLQNSFQNSFKASINCFEILNNSYHNQYESKLSYIIKDAVGASKKQRDKIRYELRKTFTTLYNDRKLAHLDTFQIFDKNGVSILRFHRLDKYDDKVLETRDSLKNMSKYTKINSGFEIGKYATSYKFQYPLFYDGEFVGSYEFGIDFNAIDEEMQKLFGIKNVLFLNAQNLEKVENKQTIKKLYKKIYIGNNKFYMLKTKMNQKIEKRFHRVLNILKHLQETPKNKPIFKKVVFKHQRYIIMTTPIKNINSKYIGFILTGTKDDISLVILKDFIEESIFAILFGIIAIFFIYKELEYKKYIRNIIDTQHDMLVITDGHKIKDANQAFLDFFGIKELSELKKRQEKCICDYFIQKDGYLQKKMDGMNWIHYIKKHPNGKNIAIMQNKDRENRYIKITIEGFSQSNDFIILLSDVTDTLKKQYELENKAYYDTLTQIYTRERFDFFLEQKLKQRREFSLIMFDIDHFKNINDTYGHDVGDIILKEIVQLVSIHIREDDIFARWGGEEFMIIVNTDLTKAEKFANKLRQIIQENNFTTVGHITCSFGVAGYRKDDTFNTIIKRVDTMLYSAKNSGRNCVVVVN